MDGIVRIYIGTEDMPEALVSTKTTIERAAKAGGVLNGMFHSADNVVVGSAHVPVCNKFAIASTVGGHPVITTGELFDTMKAARQRLNHDIFENPEFNKHGTCNFVWKSKHEVAYKDRTVFKIVNLDSFDRSVLPRIRKYIKGRVRVCCWAFPIGVLFMSEPVPEKLGKTQLECLIRNLKDMPVVPIGKDIYTEESTGFNVGLMRTYDEEPKGHVYIEAQLSNKKSTVLGDIVFPDCESFLDVNSARRWLEKEMKRQDIPKKYLSNDRKSFVCNKTTWTIKQI